MTDPVRPAALITALVLAGPAVPSAERAARQGELADLAAQRGGLVIATCQRVEAYLPELLGPRDIDLAAGSAILHGREAVRHAVALAIGLESAIMAEDQVLHQVRRAVADARRARLPRDLETAFEIALRAGRVARSWRPGPALSLADVAVERVLGEQVAGRPILVVGTGEMGRLAALAVARSGAAVAIASGTPSRAAQLARTAGGEAWPLDPGERVLGIGGVVLALGRPWQLAARSVDALGSVPLLVDLSVPRSAPADLVARLGPRFVDVDSLAAGARVEPSSRTGLQFRARLERLLERSMDEFEQRVARRDSAELARALASRAEHERTEELAELWRRLPDLPAADRAAIEGMSRHLARRLLRDPLERLGDDPDGRGLRAARDLFGL